MKGLKELRQEWEQGWDAVLCVPVKVDNYAKVFVILQKVVEKVYVEHSGQVHNPKYQYKLHRYFRAAEIRNSGNVYLWEISVDVQATDTLINCLKPINECKDVRDSYKEIVQDVQPLHLR